MINQSHIVSLIKSLSPSEKGYLKKQFSVHHVHELKQSFEMLEKEILETDKSKQKKFTSDPSELFYFVMNALQAYHHNSAKDVRSMFNQIELLVDKNLYQQAEKQVTRAKGLVEKSKLIEQYIEVLEWEMAMLAIKAPTLENEKKFEAIFDQINATIKKQKESI